MNMQKTFMTSLLLFLLVGLLYGLALLLEWYDGALYLALSLSGIGFALIILLQTTKE